MSFRGAFHSQLAAFLSFILLFSSALALELRVSNPKSCGDATVEWTGGSPPFELLFSPSYATPLNYSIPEDAFNDGEGSFSFPITLEKDKTFLVTMWDSTGIANGVVSQILTIQAPDDENQCEIQEPDVDFWFDTPNSLMQCRDYAIRFFDERVVFPATIYGFVPLGNISVMTVAASQRNYNWEVSAASGTRIMFVSFDSQGHRGGATDILTVGSSDVSFCLDDSSPSSTASRPPGPTESDPPPPAETSEGASDRSEVSMAAIAGTVIGSLLFLAMVITLAIFFIRRRKDSQGNLIPASPFDRRRSRRQYHSDLDLNGDNGNDPFTAGSQTAFFPNNQPRTPGDYTLPDGHQPSPFVLSPLPPTTPSSHHHDQRGGMQYPAQESPFDDRQSQASSSSMSAGQRKRAMAGSVSYKPTRFIMHTDIDDSEPQPNDDGVIELPPQYTARRGQPSAPQPSTAQPDPYSPTSGPPYQSGFQR